MELKQMTIFIKPTNNKFCIAVFSMQETSVKLMRVAFAANETGCIDFLKQCGDIEEVLFDGSVYAHTGIGIREKMDLPVRIFKNKGNVHDRIAAQQEWILGNIKFNADMKCDGDYSYFISKTTDYDRENQNCDTASAELLADAARYFRIRIRD